MVRAMKSFLLSAVILALASASVRAAEFPLTVDKKNSRIEYAATATMGSFSGTVIAYTLDLMIDPEKPGKFTRAELHFRFADLRSGHNGRDQNMRDWQNTEQFPECVFSLIALEPAATPGRFTARGQFIFHGMTRDLVFPVTLTSKPDGLELIDGEARIDTRAFGLPVFRKFLVNKVDPVVTVKLHIEARPVAPK
jgi:polyisoprenoid-binding protein YceI